ncbi:MAG: transporter substrate-binding domain-containing protein [Acidobacteriota bacterium]|nr:transporter substrate-binding domain-containing protein [Acidobacteriota bacterium]
MDRLSSSLRALAVSLACLCALACGGLPRDPESTLRRAQQNGRLRVGLVEHPPWVVRAQGEPAGAEVELVRGFASEIGATPEWVWGGEQQHMEALEQYQLDLVVGGLTSKTAWSKYVGLTADYFEDRVIVAVPAGGSLPSSIKGTQVAVERGDAAAYYVKSEGATPVFVDDLRSAKSSPAAGPDWRLQGMGMIATGVELSKEKHVMAVPPGENALIKRLDEYLAGRRGQIRALLQREDARR